jgi:hypothetical protein
LLVLLLTLAFVGGVTMSIMATKFHGNLPGAIWWSFLHLTDTGYMGDDNEPHARIISVILTFSGAIFFLGGVIAILTTALDRLLLSLAKGSTPVIEDGHLLLIGWNPGVPILIEELYNSAALAQIGPLPTIVLLMETQVDGIADKLSPHIRKRLRLITRQGSLADISSLERVDFRHAKAILLLSQRHRLGHHASDLALLKTLMTLSANGLDPDQCRLVMDLSHPTNRLLASEVAPTIEILPCLEFSGRLLCQVIRNPGIAKVYQQLLTDAFGLSLIMVSCRQLQAQGLTLPDLAGRLQKGTAIGFVRQGTTYLLNFTEPTHIDDELIVLAANSHQLQLQPTQPAFPAPSAYRPIQSEPHTTKILVVGRNEALISMLGELARYKKEHYQIDILCENTQGLPLNRWPNIQLNLHQGRLRQIDDLELVPATDYHRIVLLSTEILDPLSSDAETAMAYTVLRRAPLTHPNVRFILDLQEDDNRALFPAPDCDLLVSSQIGNHMLAQVAMKPAWRPVYEELFTAGGAELWLISWSRLFGSQTSQTDLSWTTIQKMALKNGQLLIGYQQKGALQLNPKADQPIQIDPQTQLLVVERDHTRTHSTT